MSFNREDGEARDRRERDGGKPPRQAGKPPRQAEKPLVRALLIAGGVAAVALGIVGLFLPILPTTPFLLLAGACFIRSSPRLHTWLMTHPWFGDYIRHYQKYRAVPLRAKLTSLSLLWLTIGFSVVVVLEAWWLRALLLLIAASVTVHLVRLKTLTPQLLRELEGDPPCQPRAAPVTPGSADSAS